MSWELDREPDREVPVILGEWWYVDAIAVDQQAFSTGGPTRPADALTINGHIGALFNCSNFTSNSSPTMHPTAAAGGGVFTSYELKVDRGKTYLLRIINFALNNQFFFKIAAHSFTVVAVDASYTKPYNTDVIAIAPGQTVDALLLADAPPKRYYMAARVLETADPPAPIFVDGIATAVLEYSDSDSSNSAVPPVLPALPASNDTATGNRFLDALRGLVRPGHPGVPLHVDERLFVTVGLGFADCLPSQALCRNRSLAASMNNVSFLFPTEQSLLQSALSPGATTIGDEGIPDRPPVAFDFTDVSVNTEPRLAALLRTSKRTSVRKVRYNAVVEVVLQNTAIIGTESHPHAHPRPQLLRRGDGIRELRRRGGEEAAEPGGPRGAEHRGGAGQRVGGDPVDGQQPRRVVRALPHRHAPPLGPRHRPARRQRTNRGRHPASAAAGLPAVPQLLASFAPSPAMHACMPPLHSTISLVVNSFVRTADCRQQHPSSSHVCRQFHYVNTIHTLRTGFAGGSRIFSPSV